MSSDGGATWSGEQHFEEAMFGGVNKSLVQSKAGTYIYEFRAKNDAGYSADTWILTLTFVDVVEANINFYVGRDQNYETNGNKYPSSVDVSFQVTFAMITVALICGAIAERVKYSTWMLFVALWVTFDYAPMAHMVWNNGLLSAKGPISTAIGAAAHDFAGGTVVHINAGITALVLSIFLGPRYQKQTRPYSLPWVLLGTAILWLGWYGFNAGSAFGMNQTALTACLTSTVAAAASMMTWLLLEEAFSGKASLDGICTGTLCGLVGITPGAGYETCAGALFTGILCSLASYFFISQVKGRLSFDDPLDAFGCHGISGIVGSLTVGLFASQKVDPAISTSGLFYGGSWELLGKQVAGTLFTIVFTLLMVSLITAVLKRFVNMRVSARDEEVGLDLSEHGEFADCQISASQDIFGK